MAIVLPFVEVPSRRARGAAFYRVDRVSAPVQFVPLLSLGCRVDVRSCAADAAASEIQYYISQLQADAGGSPLQSMRLSWDMFGASAMKAEGAGLHLSKMKVKQLADELGAWKATKSGRKRQMQLRLRALIIAAASGEC